MRRYRRHEQRLMGRLCRKENLKGVLKAPKKVGKIFGVSFHLRQAVVFSPAAAVPGQDGDFPRHVHAS